MFRLLASQDYKSTATQPLKCSNSSKVEDCVNYFNQIDAWHHGVSLSEQSVMWTCRPSQRLTCRGWASLSLPWSSYDIYTATLACLLFMNLPGSSYTCNTGRCYSYISASKGMGGQFQSVEKFWQWCYSYSPTLRSEIAQWHSTLVARYQALALGLLGAVL